MWALTGTDVGALVAIPVLWALLPEQNARHLWATVGDRIPYPLGLGFPLLGLGFPLLGLGYPLLGLGCLLSAHTMGYPTSAQSAPL